MEKNKIKILIGAVVFTVLGGAFSVMNVVVHLSDWDKAATVSTVVFGLFTLYGIGLFVMYAREKRLEKNAEERISAAFKSGGITASGIDVKVSANGEMTFVGEFDIGELGVFKGENVALEFNKSDFGKNLSDEEARAKAVELLKAKQAEFVENGKSLRDYFLLMMVLESHVSDNGFWQSYKTPGNKLSDEKCAEIFDGFAENDIDIYGVLDSYNKLGLKTVGANVYELISDKLGFFDINKLLKNIRLECVHISLNEISIQLSDKNSEVFVGAYESFDNELIPQDWHNF